MPSSGPVLAFVNEQAVRVATGATMAEAVAAFDPAFAGLLHENAAYLTDARGIRLEPGASVFDGAIIRVVVRSRSSPSEADAHP